MARSKTKCNIFGRKCCMGKIYQQLSIEERTMIQTQLEMGIKPAAIALGLNRSASTLSRELRRNGWTRPKARRCPGRPPVAGGYRAQAAQKRAHACTVRARVARRLRPGNALWDQVIHYLKAGYSPEQIAGTLTLVNAETPTLQVSHETIYTAIYAMPRGELRTKVIGWLRFGHAKRRPRARGEDRRRQIQTGSAFMTARLKLKSDWCQGTGRAISSRGRITARPSVRWWSAPPCPAWPMPVPTRL